MEFLAKKAAAKAATPPTTKQKGDAAEDLQRCAICKPPACGCWRAIIGRRGAAAAKST
jgi:hypothetical protein